MLKRLKMAAASFRRKIAVYQRVRQHPRTPKMAKILIGTAIAYALSPIDLIPDFIPVLGHLDDDQVRNPALVPPVKVFLNHVVPA